MAGKQAKILSVREFNQALDFIKSGRDSQRNTVMFLLSFKAGLRAKEIACIKWSMVTDASNQISDVLQLTDNSSKGKSGRIIPLNSQLKKALIDLHELRSPKHDQYIIYSQRAPKMYATNIVNWFAKVYASLRLEGCSSHSGRRTFVTMASKKLYQAGGSLKDLQQMVGHKSLQTTSRYIEGDTEAKRKLVEMI